METNADHFIELSVKQFDVTNPVIKNESDSFKIVNSVNKTPV